MKRRAATGAAVILACILGVVALVGCNASGSTGSGSSAGVNADIPEKAAPLVPESHIARMDNLNRLGSNACYGCHGANEGANPMLNGITAMPEDHYLSADPTTCTLDPSHELCNTCHVQGYRDSGE